MGTCVLKDCGFEYQKLKIKKGITIEQYFKEILNEKKAKTFPTKKKPEYLQNMNVEDPPLSLYSTETTPSPITKRKHNNFPSNFGNGVNPSPPPSSLTPPFSSTILADKSNDHFTPLLENMGENASSVSWNKSPENIRGGLEKEKYEKSSLFEVARRNFVMNEVSSEEGDYDNIFSDDESTIGKSNQNLKVKNIKQKEEAKLYFKSLFARPKQMVFFKVEFNQEIRILPSSPKKYDKMLECLKSLFNDSPTYPLIKYRGKDGFYESLTNDQDLNQVLKYCEESKLKALKLIVSENNDNLNLYQDKLSGFGNVVSPRDTDDKNEKNMSKDRFFERIRNSKTLTEQIYFNSDIEPVKEHENSCWFPNKNAKKNTEEKTAEVISKDNKFRNIHDFSKINCYKCEGTGQNLKKNRPCKKCNGSKNSIQSKKIDVIDYLIKELLPNLYEEYSKLPEKLESSSPTQSSVNRAPTCSVCNIVLYKTVQFKCMECINKYLCEKCEATHEHNVLKIKKSPEQQLRTQRSDIIRNFGSKSVQLANSFEESNYKKPSTFARNSDRNATELIKSQFNLGSSMIDERFSRNSLNNSQSLNSSVGLANNKVRVLVLREPNPNLRIACGEEFTVLYEFQNDGDCAWPQDLSLENLSGPYQDTPLGIPSLKPGEKYELNMNLIASKKEETLNSYWRFCYRVNNSKKFFGPRLQLTVETINKRTIKLKDERK